MKFNLSGGGYTEVIFHRDNQGVTHPFPKENADLIMRDGTEESKKTLEKIITEGIYSSNGRVYVAFMGPPIPPYRMVCECGKEIKVGHDENGYYVEGASEIIFENENGRPKTLPFT